MIHHSGKRNCGTLEWQQQICVELDGKRNDGNWCGVEIEEEGLVCGNYEHLCENNSMWKKSTDGEQSSG